MGCPTVKRFFDALRCCITEGKCRNCPWEDCKKVGGKRVTVPVTLMLDVPKLLKEQEPKTVCVTWQNENCKDGKCPSCGYPLTTDLYPKFCGFCGQAVIWND